MYLPLQGRVAIVTAGGGPGMGSAISRALAREGAGVAVADLNPVLANKTADEIRASGGKAIAVPADASKKKHVLAMVERTVKEFGAISILINHAGISPGGPILDLTEEYWDKAIAVHLKGAFMATQAVLPYMIKERWGRIVSTSSRAAYAPGTVGMSDYAAVKAGIIGLSRAVAMEVGQYGITVNCVAPGNVSGSGMAAAQGRPPRTPQQELEIIGREGQILRPIRYVRPDEIADAVLYLVKAERVTGTVMHVNGGSYMPG